MDRGALKSVTLAVLAVMATAGVGLSIYLTQQNGQLSSDLTTKNNQIADLQKQQTPPADPYAGWQSATLKYEKATFKYPSTWKVTNTSTAHSSQDAVTPGYDKATVVSPTGLTVTIDTGVSGIGDGPYGFRPIATTPIITLGGNYYLGFGVADPDSPGVVNGGTIGTTSDRTATWPSSKNISSVNGQSLDVISIGYFDAPGNAIAKPVSAFQSDSSYNDALLIIKSLSY